MLPYLLRLFIGILAIDLAVLIHEAGHLVAARMSGISVEVFSIGMGPRLVGWDLGSMELRISLLPVGGYCRMRGADDLARAIERGGTSFDGAEAGSIFAASPLTRIITYLAGPLSNALAAILLFSVLDALPTAVQSHPALIATVNDYPTLFDPSTSSAFDYGLRSGDLVLSFDGTDILDYEQLESLLAKADESDHRFLIERDGKQMEFTARSDDGRWGLTLLEEPVIATVEKGSPEAKAGLRSGQRIVMAGGRPVENSLDLLSELAEHKDKITLDVLDQGVHRHITCKAPQNGLYHFTLSSPMRMRQNRFSLASGTKRAFTQAWAMLRSFFKLGRKQVTGMGRAAVMIGTITLSAMESGAGLAMKGFGYLLAIVCISLAVTNVLPLPAFDGGQIVLACYELATHKHIAPRLWWWIQLAGWLGVTLLMALAAFSDTLRVLGR